MSTATRVLVVGSINHDLTVRVPRLPAPGETLAATDVMTGLGGKGANQAVAVARTGVAAQLFASVGADDAGRRCRADLTDLDVDATLVRTVPDTPTGTAIVIVDADGTNSIVIAAGANAATTAEVIREASHAIATATVVVVQTEIPTDAVIDTVTIAHDGGVPVVLNLAPAVALPSTTIARATVLVVNEVEAGQLLHTDATEGTAASLDTARALVSAYGVTAVVTIGASGAVYADPAGASFHVPAPTVRAVDTTGAGDAFVGVFAAGLASGLDEHTAITRAVAAASATVERPGAAASYQWFVLT